MCWCVCVCVCVLKGMQYNYCIVTAQQRLLGIASGLTEISILRNSYVYYWHRLTFSKKKILPFVFNNISFKKNVQTNCYKRIVYHEGEKLVYVFGFVYVYGLVKNIPNTYTHVVNNTLKTVSLHDFSMKYCWTHKGKCFFFEKVKLCP